MSLPGQTAPGKSDTVISSENNECLNTDKLEQTTHSATCNVIHHVHDTNVSVACNYNRTRMSERHEENSTGLDTEDKSELCNKYTRDNDEYQIDLVKDKGINGISKSITGSPCMKDLIKMCIEIQDGIKNNHIEIEQSAYNEVITSIETLKETILKVNIRHLETVNHVANYNAGVSNDKSGSKLLGPDDVESMVQTDVTRTNDKMTQTTNHLGEWYDQLGPLIIQQNHFQNTFNSVREDSVAKHITDISVKTPEDKSMCWISGMAMLSPQTFVITDNDNKAVKIVDVKSCKVTSRLALPFTPWDVAVLPNNMIAVTLFHNESILFIKTRGELTISHIMPVSGNCCGVACYEDKLVVTFCHPGKIQILNLNGRILYTSSADLGLSRYVTYVNITKDGNCILVSDTNNHCVIKMDWRGTIVGRYMSEGQCGVCCVSPATDGTFYMCCQFTHQIIRVSWNLQKIGVIMQEANGIRDPQTVYFNDSDRTMFVGCGSDQIIKVFSLE